MTKRLKTRRLDHPWPFPVSVVDGRMVRNTYKPARPKRQRLKPVPPSNMWTQEALF